MITLDQTQAAVSPEFVTSQQLSSALSDLQGLFPFLIQHKGIIVVFNYFDIEIFKLSFFHLSIKFILDIGLDGIWRRGEETQDIKCSRNGNILKCEWGNNLVESFQIDGMELSGTTNKAIHGRWKLDTISWNTGNFWFRHGRSYRRILRTFILHF